MVIASSGIVKRPNTRRGRGNGKKIDIFAGEEMNKSPPDQAGQGYLHLLVHLLELKAHVV